MKKSFFDKVYNIVQNIPKGKVATYGDVARLAGSPKAFRAVGMAMKHNPHPERVPCNRVVASDGSMCGYSAKGGTKRKLAMLKREGVKFNGEKVDLQKSRWDGKIG